MSIDSQLAGKTALVTGAGQGIGFGIARVLGQRGANVAAVDIDSESVRNALTEINSGHERAVGYVADVRSASEMQDVVEKAIAEFGSLDICVPNAGVIASASFEERESYVDEDWDLTLDVNVLGVVNTVDAILPHMKERRSGKIVIISSQGGRAPRGATLPLGPAIMPYLVSKSASIQLMHHLAMELGQFNINVNAVCPGTVWTPMWERIAANRISADPALSEVDPRQLFEQALESRHPITREQTPEDIGKAVAFLSSDDAAQITGQAVNVNGGAVMS